MLRENMEKTICSHLKTNKKKLNLPSYDFMYDENIQNEILKLIHDNPKNFIRCIKSKGFKRRYENRQHLVDYVLRCTSTLVDTSDFAYSYKK